MHVLVVGAGPAGAALALALSRAGIATTLVEAATNFDRELRGEALMPSGLDALKALGLAPIPPAVPQRLLAGWTVVVQGQPCGTTAVHLTVPEVREVVQPVVTRIQMAGKVGRVVHKLPVAQQPPWCNQVRLKPDINITGVTVHNMVEEAEVDGTAEEVAVRITHLDG